MQHQRILTSEASLIILSDVVRYWSASGMYETAAGFNWTSRATSSVRASELLNLSQKEISNYRKVYQKTFKRWQKNSVMQHSNSSKTFLASYRQIFLSQLSRPVFNDSFLLSFDAGF